jgi:hypothetical protein
MIPDPPTVLFAVIRSGGTAARPWHVLGSAMFATIEDARRFADVLDHGHVYRLDRVED